MRKKSEENIKIIDFLRENPIPDIKQEYINCLIVNRCYYSLLQLAYNKRPPKDKDEKIKHHLYWKNYRKESGLNTKFIYKIKNLREFRNQFDYDSTVCNSFQLNITLKDFLYLKNVLEK